jgi:hypothetical protein
VSGDNPRERHGGGEGGGNAIGGDLGGSDAQGAARSHVQRRQQRTPFVELC